jgi:hypothetical protein
MSRIWERYVQEHQMVSVMNNTKWHALIKAITSDESFDPPVNIKYVLDTYKEGKKCLRKEQHTLHLGERNIQGVWV